MVNGTVSGVGETSVAFTAFPNPANDAVVVNTHGFEPKDLQIVDATGRVVLSERLVGGQNVINVTNLANGTYQMVLTEENNRVVKQLVVAH